MPYMEGALWKWTNYVSGEYNLIDKSKSLHVERCFKFSLQTVIAIFFS